MLNTYNNYLDRKKKIPLRDLLFLTAFSIYLIRAVFATTMFYEYFDNGIYLLIRLATIILIFIKIFLFDKYTLKKLIIIVMLGVCAILSGFISGYHVVWDLIVLIIGSKDVSFRRIVITYFYVTTAIMIIALVSSQVGIIEDLVYIRDGKARHSFGSVYTTDFVAHIYFLILSFCYIKKKKVSFLNIFIIALLGILTYRLCNTRLDSVCILIVAAIYLYILIKHKYKKIKKKNGIIIRAKKFLLIFSVPLAAILAICATILYDPSNVVMLELNKLFSNRFVLGKQGIDEYGFSLFGQYVFMQGNGMTVERHSDYFFIDSSYLNIALRYGVVLLIIFCLYYMFICYQRIKQGDYKLPLIIALIALNSIVAQHLFEIAYNPFLLVMMASIELPNVSEKQNH